MTRKEEIAFFKRIDKMEKKINQLMEIVSGPQYIIKDKSDAFDEEPENKLDGDYELETLEVENNFELSLDDDE